MNYHETEGNTMGQYPHKSKTPTKTSHLMRIWKIPQELGFTTSNENMVNTPKIQAIGIDTMFNF